MTKCSSWKTYRKDCQGLFLGGFYTTETNLKKRHVVDPLWFCLMVSVQYSLLFVCVYVRATKHTKIVQVVVFGGGVCCDLKKVILPTHTPHSGCRGIFQCAVKCHTRSTCLVVFCRRIANGETATTHGECVLFHVSRSPLKRFNPNPSTDGSAADPAVGPTQTLRSSSSSEPWSYI